MRSSRVRRLAPVETTIGVRTPPTISAFSSDIVAQYRAEASWLERRERCRRMSCCPEARPGLRSLLVSVRLRAGMLAIIFVVLGALAVPGGANAAARARRWRSTRAPTGTRSAPTSTGSTSPTRRSRASSRFPVDRWGGNTTDTYNWRLWSSNTGNDYFFENVADCWNAADDWCAGGAGVRLPGVHREGSRGRRRAADHPADDRLRRQGREARPPVHLRLPALGVRRSGRLRPVRLRLRQRGPRGSAARRRARPATASPAGRRTTAPGSRR